MGSGGTRGEAVLFKPCKLQLPFCEMGWQFSTYLTTKRSNAIMLLYAYSIVTRKLVVLLIRKSVWKKRPVELLIEVDKHEVECNLYETSWNQLLHIMLNPIFKTLFHLSVFLILIHSLTAFSLHSQRLSLVLGGCKKHHVYLST